MATTPRKFLTEILGTLQGLLKSGEEALLKIRIHRETLHGEVSILTLENHTNKEPKEGEKRKSMKKGEEGKRKRGKTREWRETPTSYGVTLGRKNEEEEFFSLLEKIGRELSLPVRKREEDGFIIVTVGGE